MYPSGMPSTDPPATPPETPQIWAQFYMQTQYISGPRPSPSTHSAPETRGAGLEMSFGLKSIGFVCGIAIVGGQPEVHNRTFPPYSVRRTYGPRGLRCCFCRRRCFSMLALIVLAAILVASCRRCRRCRCCGIVFTDSCNTACSRVRKPGSRLRKSAWHTCGAVRGLLAARAVFAWSAVEMCTTSNITYLHSGVFKAP
jgi:hypothetical protein